LKRTMGILLVLVGVLFFWANENRFDYYDAAKNAKVIGFWNEHDNELIALTGKLDMTIPVTGEYVEQFGSFYRVWREAEIFIWTRWGENGQLRKEWSKDLDDSSGFFEEDRNSGLVRSLSKHGFFSPTQYIVGDLKIPTAAGDPPTSTTFWQAIRVLNAQQKKPLIQFIDQQAPIRVRTLTLSEKGISKGLTKYGNHFYLRKSNKTGDSIGDERISYVGIPQTEVATYFGQISNGQGIGQQLEPKRGMITKFLSDTGYLHHLVNGDREDALRKMEERLSGSKLRVRVGSSIVVLLGVCVIGLSQRKSVPASTRKG
jgi:hypothetical protein